MIFLFSISLNPGDNFLHGFKFVLSLIQLIVIIAILLSLQRRNLNFQLFNLFMNLIQFLLEVATFSIDYRRGSHSFCRAQIQVVELLCPVESVLQIKSNLLKTTKISLR